MSFEQLAGVGLRITQIANMTANPGNDLTSLDSKEFPDGALVYVIGSKILFALDKASTVAENGTTVVEAIGGGNWIAVTSASANLYGVTIQSVVATGTPTTGALVDDTWTALPSATSQYSKSGAAIWTASTSTGVLTYTGPTRDFIVVASLTAAPGTGTTSRFCFSVSRSNAAIIGTTTDQNGEARMEFAAVEEGNMNFTTYLSSFTAAQTLQGCVRNVDGTDALTIVRYQLTVIPVP